MHRYDQKIQYQKPPTKRDNTGRTRKVRRRRRRKKRLFTRLHLLFAVIGIFILMLPSILSQNNTILKKADKSVEERFINPSPLNSKSEKVADSSDWSLVLVNETHSIPEDFSVETTALSGGHAVDSRIYQALQNMLDAARAEGLSPLICSSYRTMEKQTSLYNAQVDSWLNQGYSLEEAKEQAAQWVAPPGYSEHQTGLALDIVAASYQMLNEAQEDTPEQIWLMEHCAEYGFILRYPSDKSHITGIGYEPWHYRYVGEAAKVIMEQGICLEEYLDSTY